MWKAFWGNLRPVTSQGLALPAKLQLLNRSARPCLDYRASRWPPQLQIAKEVDGMQRRMVALIMRLPRREGESPEEFFRRRARSAGKACSDCGTWSQRWFRRSIAWDEHLRRDRNSTSWPAQLLEYHGGTWLAAQRLMRRSPSVFAGWTGTRASSGKVHMRWHDGIELAQQLVQN